MRTTNFPSRVNVGVHRVVEWERELVSDLILVCIRRFLCYTEFGMYSYSTYPVSVKHKSRAHPTPAECAREIVAGAERQDGHRRRRRHAERVDHREDPADGTVAAAAQHAQVRHLPVQLQPARSVGSRSRHEFTRVSACNMQLTHMQLATCTRTDIQCYC